MVIKDLPKIGLGFKASFSKPGAPSLQKALNRIAVRNSAFRNLSKGNVATIAKVIKPAEKSIRLKGGMSRYQIKGATRKLWQEYKTTKGTADEFSKEDIKDAKEIMAEYKKGNNVEKAVVKKPISRLPYLVQEVRPNIGMSSINQVNTQMSSIKSVTDRRVGSIGSLMN